MASSYVKFLWRGPVGVQLTFLLMHASKQSNSILNKDHNRAFIPGKFIVKKRSVIDLQSLFMCLVDSILLWPQGKQNYRLPTATQLKDRMSISGFQSQADAALC